MSIFSRLWELKKTWRIFSCLCLFVVIKGTALEAAVFQKRPIGARAIALSGAFTAGQKDVTSIFWNPAALTTLETTQLEFSYIDLYSQGLINFSDVSFAYPNLGPGAFGVSWTRLGVSNKVPFDYSENTYTLAYGIHLHRRFSLGTSLNFHRLDSSVNGSAFGLNAAFQFRPASRLIVGAIYRNLARTSIRYDSGAEDVLADDLNLGISIPLDKARIYANFDNVSKTTFAHSGLEIPLFQESLAIRGGASHSTEESDSEWIYSLGFGVTMRALGLDYAFENHFDLGGSHAVSVRWSF